MPSRPSRAHWALTAAATAGASLVSPMSPKQLSEFLAGGSEDGRPAVRSFSRAASDSALKTSGTPSSRFAALGSVAGSVSDSSPRDAGKASDAAPTSAPLCASGALLTAITELARGEASCAVTAAAAAAAGSWYGTGAPGYAAW